MARLTDYSPRQRLMLQVAMWLVLGATVGLAAMVTRYRTASSDVDLTEPATIGRFRVRLPANWTIFKPTDPRSVLAFKAVEKKRSKGVAPREAWIFYQKLPKYIPADEFLSQQRVIGFDDTDAEVRTITIAGYQGLRFDGPYLPRIGPLVLGSPRTVTTLVVVLPEGSALAIKYLCDIKPTKQDEALIQQLVHRIEVADEP